MDCALAVSLKMSTSQRTLNTVKSKVNNCKLINLVIRIEFTRTILIPLFSNFLKKIDIQFSHVFIFRNMFPESHSFVSVPVIRSNNFVSLHSLDGDKLEHVSLETFTLKNYSNFYLQNQMHLSTCLTIVS